MSQPPVNGQASWHESLQERYDNRARLLDDLRRVQAEISSLQLVMLIQQLDIGESDDGTTGSR